MGNAPLAAPSAERAAALRAELPSTARTAAVALAVADFVLVCVGQGARDRDDPEDDPEDDPADELPLEALRRDPAGYYGCWGRRFNAARLRGKGTVLDAVARWGGTGGSAEWYAFTTETDGRARAALGPGGVGVWECHGSTELWRCASGCAGLWRAPDEFLFRLEADAASAAGAAGEARGDASSTGGGVIAPPGGPHRRAVYHRVEMSCEEAMDCALDSASGFRTNHPVCIACGGAARPSVRLANADYTYKPDAEALEAYEAWKRKVLGAVASRGAKLVILELGCGGGEVAEASTARHEAESFAATVNCLAAQPAANADADADVAPSSPRATLVRVHAEAPEPDATPAELAGTPVLSLLSDCGAAVGLIETCFRHR